MIGPCLRCMMQAPGYYDIVKNPIDLLTISDRLREQSRVNSDVVYYRTKHMLRADLLRMVSDMSHVTCLCLIVNMFCVRVLFYLCFFCMHVGAQL